MEIALTITGRIYMIKLRPENSDTVKQVLKASVVQDTTLDKMQLAQISLYII